MPRRILASVLTTLGLLAPLGMASAGNPVAALDPDKWQLAANHLHSSPGGQKAWPKGIKHIAQYCDSHDIAFACLTDHNTIGGWFMPEFSAGHAVTMIRGEEWTSSQGHANLIDYRASSEADVILPAHSSRCKHDEPREGEEEGPAPGQAGSSAPCPVDHQGMVDLTHQRGGLVFINHPGLPLYPWPENTFGADACEVGRNFLDFGGQKSFAWWLRRLEEGSRITAVAGSDYHYLRPTNSTLTPRIDTPINAVLAPTADVAGFRAAITSRHVQVLRSRKSPRIYLAAATLDHETFTDGMMGDVLDVPAGSTVKLRLRITGARGRTLEILDSTIGGSPAERTVTKVKILSDDFEHDLRRTGSGKGSSFTVVSVASLETLANPIWY